MVMHSIRIRGYHTDSYGHVNHARYLEFLEDARWAVFEQHNMLPDPKQLILVVSHIDIRYLRSAKAGDTVQITTVVKHLAPCQIVLNQTVYLENGKTAAAAEVTLISVDPQTSRSIDLPETIADFLRTYQPEKAS